MRFTATVVVGLALCSSLIACDTPERVEGLERRVDGLIDQQREAAETLTETKDALEQAKQDASSAKAEVTALTSRLDEMSSKVSLLEEEIADLKTKQEELPKPVVRPGRPDPTERYRVEVGDSPVDGASDAKITIVIFSDFQCPFCKRVQTTLDEVQREYGKDVRLVAKHNPLPFHREALPAAIAAESAHRQDKFWEMHDKLYENNRALTHGNFVKWAKDLGLDVKQFKKDLKDSTLEDRIKDDQSLATKVGARGTPAFFINGRFLSGAQPFASFKTLIDEEIKEADKRLASGTSPSSLYDSLMRTAKSGV